MPPRSPNNIYYVLQHFQALDLLPQLSALATLYPKASDDVANHMDTSKVFSHAGICSQWSRHRSSSTSVAHDEEHGSESYHLRQLIYLSRVLSRLPPLPYRPRVPAKRYSLSFVATRQFTFRTCESQTIASTFRKLLLFAISQTVVSESGNEYNPQIHPRAYAPSNTSLERNKLSAYPYTDSRVFVHLYKLSGSVPTCSVSRSTKSPRTPEPWLPVPLII